MLYGAETWASKKSDEKRMDVSEMRMLRWECGITRQDRVRNDYVRGSLKVAPISMKVKETRLRWFGHVMRREANHPTRRTLEMEPPGRRRRGRPALRWKDCVARDMRELGVEEDWRDRNGWRKMLQSHFSDPK